MRCRRGLVCTVLTGVLALAGCGEDGGRADSLEALARISVEALKTGDFSVCEPYMFTTQDVNWLVTTMADGTSRKAEKIRTKHREKGSDAMLAELRERNRKSFEALRKGLVDEEIDPLTLEFDRIHKPRQESVDGVEVGECYIRLLIDGKPGEIRLKTCFHAPRGWLFGEGWKS